MSDWVAGLLGVVIGGLITGGTNLGMAWRREKREARAARRIIRSELEEAAEAVKVALEYKEWPAGWTKKTWSESWSIYRPSLALDIDDDEFEKIATAYLLMGLLETGLAKGKRDFEENDPAFLTRVSPSLSAAIEAISEPHAFASAV